MEIKDFSDKVEFTNDGRLSLFFVGTGSAFSKEFFQNNLIIVKGNDHILIDCGTLLPFILEVAYHTKISKIENIILTHPHADHIGGVEELILNGRYVKKSKINIIINDEFKELLWNQSLRGGCQYSEDGEMTFDDYFNQIKPSEIPGTPWPMWEANLGSINVKLFRSFHVTTLPNSFEKSQFSVGMIIDNRVLFTGDTQFKPEQLDWILKNYNIECIFHDCDISGYGVGVHTSYEQLNTLPADVKRKMYLCHYNKNACKVNSKADGFAGFARKGKYYIFD